MVDWSSDGCSSDLRHRPLQHDCNAKLLHEHTSLYVIINQFAVLLECFVQPCSISVTTTDDDFPESVLLGNTQHAKKHTIATSPVSGASDSPISPTAAQGCASSLIRNRSCHPLATVAANLIIPQMRTHHRR